VRPSGLLTEAVGRQHSGTTKRAAASDGTLIRARPPAAPERGSLVHEHGEREGRSWELTRGSLRCGAAREGSSVAAEILKRW
jgi:hypothetical protein